MSAINTFIDLTKELRGVVLSEGKKKRPYRKLRCYKTSQRMKFLDDYAKDIEKMSCMWLKKLGVCIDDSITLQDVLQEVKIKALTSRTWYDKERSCKSKPTTFLYIIIRNAIFGMMRKHSKEIPFSHLNNIHQFLKNGYYEEIESILEDEVPNKDGMSYDYIDGVIDVQKELKNHKPLLSYIFYGYLMGHRNSDIARALSVTEMFIGLEWNKFVKTFRRFRCRVLPFFQRKLSMSAV